MGTPAEKLPLALGVQHERYATAGDVLAGSPAKAAGGPYNFVEGTWSK